MSLACRIGRALMISARRHFSVQATALVDPGNVPTDALEEIRDDDIERAAAASGPASIEDLSHLKGAARTATFNLAPLVNGSRLLRRLVDLGVDLSRVERRPPVAKRLLALDFDADVAPRVAFLARSVPAERLGDYLSTNPRLLLADLDDMRVRVNYLQSKRFDEAAIARCVSRNPYWLCTPVAKIDRRLGHFQKRFALSGDEVRALAVAEPRLITHKRYHVDVNTFALKEEMGFEEGQLKAMLLAAPKIWMINQRALIKTFNYVHLTMNVSHEDICRTPVVLLTRASRFRQRHGFLVRIGADRFDPTKPNYVPLMKVVEGTDAEFCFDVAKCTVDDYNAYLKSL